MLHKAIDLAQSGEVIADHVCGDLTNALIREMMLSYAVKKGAAGFVSNCAIRNLNAFVATNIPTFVAGVTHRVFYEDGPGAINGPISLDGMVVAPGDIVLGDFYGVLPVPQNGAPEILKKAQV